MLRGIHKASASWLGKGIMAVIMGLLVISFAIWGIGDIFRGFGRSTFATIGNTEISIEQFRFYYTDRMNQLGRRLGRPVTPDQVRALGLDQQLVGQLVAETVLDERARQMRLGVNDAEIARRITIDPNFKGLNGQFDKFRFDQMIREAGFTETRYVQEQRRLTIRRQIALAVSGDLKPPAAAQDAIYFFRFEKRSADLLLLGPAQAGDIPAPTPDELAKYFEERKAMFRAPETRKVVLVSLTPADQARWSTVSDEDAKAYYEQHKGEYGTLERRQLRQIVFTNADEAKAAADKLAKGARFEDIAKERNLKDADVDLGTVTQAAMIDPAVGTAAFALKQGEISAPVAGRFGTVIVQAVKIEPASQQSYEQAAAEIKRNLATTRARREIGELRDKIEDERASGATLAETARKLSLSARTIEAIDRSGRDAAGNPVPDLAQGVDLLGPVFNSDIGVDNEPLALPGNGYLWYDVAGISKSRDRTLEEIKPQVEARLKDDQIADRLKTKADELLDKIKSGTPLAQLAGPLGVKIEPAADLQRRQARAPVSAAALEAIFRTSKGAAGSAEGDRPSSRIVFVVTDVVDPKPDPKSPEAVQLQEALRRGFGEDVLNQYVVRLESDLGVKINQSALQQVVGGGTAN